MIEIISSPASRAALSARDNKTLVFPYFCRSAIHFQEAQGYWEVIFDRARNGADIRDVEGLWQPHWRYNPLRDGYCIYTAICRQQHIAVQINQKPPAALVDALAGWDWWVDSTGQPGRPDHLRTLIITCTPSRANMPRIVSLLTTWLRGHVLAPNEFD